MYTSIDVRVFRIRNMLARMLRSGGRPLRRLGLGRVPIRRLLSQNEKQQYDELRRRFTKTIQENPHILQSASLQRGTRLSLKTIVVLVVISSTVSMGVYLAVQVRNHSKQVFLPLWLNLNWMYQSKYRFPQHVKYFDEKYAEYLAVEMAQLNQTDGLDWDNYAEILKKNNIKYRVLEWLAHCPSKQFKLPLQITSTGSLDMYLVPERATVSGLNFNLRESTVRWCIKLINVDSAISDALVAAGLKLDRLDSTEADLKTHEPSSGRVHQVPLHSDNRRMDFNRSKDYRVVFEGDFTVKDHHGTETAVHYRGYIDFDHLMINRGVKVVEVTGDLVS